MVRITNFNQILEHVKNPIHKAIIQTGIMVMNRDQKIALIKDINECIIGLENNDLTKLEILCHKYNLPFDAIKDQISEIVNKNENTQ